MAMYVSPKRVTRNGYLIAYKGEEMSEDEALSRGLLKPKAKPKRTRKPKGE